MLGIELLRGWWLKVLLLLVLSLHRSLSRGCSIDYRHGCCLRLSRGLSLDRETNTVILTRKRRSNLGDSLTGRH